MSGDPITGVRVDRPATSWGGWGWGHMTFNHRYGIENIQKQCFRTRFMCSRLMYDILNENPNSEYWTRLSNLNTFALI